MADREFYAHTREGCTDRAKWQTLKAHLEETAQKAAQLSAAFKAEPWARAAGLWHDLGKYRPEFQEMLIRGGAGAEHSGAGGAMAVNVDPRAGKALAFTIAGHHTGLANLAEAQLGLPKPLKRRLAENCPVLKEILPSIPKEISDVDVPPLPQWAVVQLTDEREESARRRRMAFWIRFLFSVVVDADRLNTEAFYEPELSARRGRFDSVDLLRDRIDAFIDSKLAALPAEAKSRPVNLARAKVLHACRKAAELPPGTFSLTVPTGGGKTLSAMSFALRHATRHDLRRVIVVIPYTSIIEQNARQYADALGKENVVEHHSNLDPQERRRSHGEQVCQRHDLATENWDAPAIVTTSVQFFETLFAGRPSVCRKLHNVARSVIVLDEVQTLPPQFLRAILDGLRELTEHYGCSVVLSTATPPALRARERFDWGLQDVREIVADPAALSAELRRVAYDWRTQTTMPWPGLTRELADHRQVLAVVHKRADARMLAEAVQELKPDEPLFHLSALMCPAHRLTVIRQIREALAADQPCRVVSTQLIEAGVDLDFPVVYRALAGLDSVVQAAGRCNREGKLGQGRVVVFRAESAPPPGTPAKAMQAADAMLNQAGGTVDLTDPARFEEFFRRLYFSEELDARNIQRERAQFNFATISRDFRLIEDGFTRSIVVPHEEGTQRLEALRAEGPNRDTLRGLQPFIVNIYENAFAPLHKAGALEEVTPGIFALTQPFGSHYHPVFGLTVGDEPVADPGELMC